MLLDVSLENRRALKLVVKAAGDTTDGDLADWADARINCR